MPDRKHAFREVSDPLGTHQEYRPLGHEPRSSRLEDDKRSPNAFVELLAEGELRRERHGDICAVKPSELIEFCNGPATVD